MSEYEDKVNDKILTIIRYILFFVFVIGLIIIIYLNQKYSTIKLIGK
jgi:preprotein translocase subunit SecG